MFDIKTFESEEYKAPMVLVLQTESSSVLCSSDTAEGGNAGEWEENPWVIQ